MKRIKVDAEERARRKKLDLPITIPLRYMRRESNGYTAVPVISYEIVAVYYPSGTPSLLITLETGEQIRILSLYFAQMQKPTFEKDVAKVAEDEEE